MNANRHKDARSLEGCVDMMISRSKDLVIWDWSLAGGQR